MCIFGPLWRTHCCLPSSILLNSLLEEYVWRWFVFRKCELLMDRRLAVPFCALPFTVHHTLALTAWVPWQLNLIASLGVFIGGGIWSILYLRYRSIWPPYVCHIFADITIFLIGWELIMG